MTNPVERSGFFVGRHRQNVTQLIERGDNMSKNSVRS